MTAAALGGVPAAEITVAGSEPRHVVPYFHGGVYVLDDAFQAAGLAAQVGLRTTLGPSRWTTGSPPSTRIRPRSTHRLRGTPKFDTFDLVCQAFDVSPPFPIQLLATTFDP